MKFLFCVLSLIFAVSAFAQTDRLMCQLSYKKSYSSGVASYELNQGIAILNIISDIESYTFYAYSSKDFIDRANQFIDANQIKFGELYVTERTETDPQNLEIKYASINNGNLGAFVEASLVLNDGMPSVKLGNLQCEIVKD